MRDDLLQRGGRAIVKIRRCQRDVSQGGASEATHVASIARDFGEAAIVRRIGATAIEVVEAGVVEGDNSVEKPVVRARVGEVRAAVTMKAFEFFAEEEL